MSVQKIERAIIVSVGSRAALVAIAVANWDKASWAFQQWSRSGALQADIMAGAIEGSLVIFTYMLAQRLIANAKKLKSDPTRPTKTLWFFVGFLSFLSAFCNGLYFVHFGIIANPLGNVMASMVTGAVLGLAAPLLAGGIAYLQGEEAESEISAEEAKKRREEENRRRRENRRLKKQAETSSEVQLKKSAEVSPKSVEVSMSEAEGSLEYGDLSELMRGHLEKTVQVYSQNQDADLKILAEALGVGVPRASEIRALAVELRLLKRLTRREYSPNGSESSVLASTE